jgi:predicted RNA-binding protein associated with RNAse of E/G family
MRLWLPGETVVIQELWRNQLWAARPITVVHDGGGDLVLWCPKGTVRKVPATPPTRQSPTARHEWFADLLTRCDWILVDSVWDVSTLWLLREDEWHAVWVSYLDSGEHWGWYINLQEPFRRTKRGIQTMDLMLDILVERDRSWRWKDEDDFEMLLTRGLLNSITAERVRDEAGKVLQRVERSEPPFDGSWSHWRPDSTWSLPELPDSWASL